MKIVVIGGTGLIGSKLVKKLHANGHDALAASPGTGVDIISGKGLAEALAGAQALAPVGHRVPQGRVGASLERQCLDAPVRERNVKVSPGRADQPPGAWRQPRDCRRRHGQWGEEAGNGGTAASRLSLKWSVMPVRGLTRGARARARNDRQGFRFSFGFRSK